MALQFDHEGFAGWLATRPQVIRDLVRRFPPTTAWRQADGSYLYVIGWDEGGNVLVTPMCPFTDYEVALGTRKAVHPDCLAELVAEDMANWTGPR